MGWGPSSLEIAAASGPISGTGLTHLTAFRPVRFGRWAGSPVSIRPVSGGRCGWAWGMINDFPRTCRAYRRSWGRVGLDVVLVAGGAFSLWSGRGRSMRRWWPAEGAPGVQDRLGRAGRPGSRHRGRGGHHRSGVRVSSGQAGHEAQAGEPAGHAVRGKVRLLRVDRVRDMPDRSAARSGPDRRYRRAGWLTAVCEPGDQEAQGPRPASAGRVPRKAGFGIAAITRHAHSAMIEARPVRRWAITGPPHGVTHQ